MSSLFGASQSHQEIIPPQALKNQSFRQEIRRRNNNKRFRAVRQAFLISLKSLEFLEHLKSQRDNFTAKKIQQLVEGLEMGLSNQSFYNSIMDLQLDHYLCDVFNYPGLELTERNKILHTLVELTFFCSNSVQAVIDSNLLDGLMGFLKQFQMEESTEETFAYFAAHIVLNTSAEFNSDLNAYIMESDFMIILENLVEKSCRKEENLMYYRSDLREVMLKIYANLFLDRGCPVDFVGKALFRLLNDHRNSDNQFVLIQLLKCVSRAAAIPQVWRTLEKQKYGTYGLLFNQILDLSLSLKVLLLDGKEIVKGIQNFAQFLTNLYSQSEYEAEAADCLLAQLSADFLGPIIYNLQSQEAQPAKLALCKIFKMLSYATQQLDFFLFFPNNKEISQFLQTMLQKNFMTNQLYAKYCVRILWRMLKQDKTTMDLMIEHCIFDALRDLLEQQFKEQVKIEAIELMECMIEIEESSTTKKQDENKLIQTFHERGFIKEIDKLQDHRLKQLQKRAQAFMQWLSQLPSQAFQSQ